MKITMICKLNIFAATALIAACAAVGRPQPDVPTLSVDSAGYRVTRYKGQTVRICGRLVRSANRRFWQVEHVESPERFSLHGPPRVRVIACAGEEPWLDPDGCISGRIATRDGSLALPDRPVAAIEDGPVNYDWFLHPQCGRAR